MRQSYQILTFCFVIIITLLVYTLSENRNTNQTSRVAWEKYEVSFSKLMHISIMLNQMQHLTRIYLATTTTEDDFKLDELIQSASIARSTYIKHYLELEKLSLDDIEKQHLEKINQQAGKLRLAQLDFDKILIENTPLKQRLKLAIQTIVSPQNKTQSMMQDFLSYIRTQTIIDSSLYHKQEKNGREKIETLQLITVYFTFFLGIFSVFIVFKAQKTINDKNHALSKAESFLNSILNSTPIALIITNHTGQIIMANNNSVKLFEYSREQLLEMNISHLIPENMRDLHLKHLLNYNKKPIIREMHSGLEITALKNSGQIIPVEVGLSPVDGQDELYIACSIKDITQQKAMAQEMMANKNKAEQASHAKTEFLTHVSHELRTPLHAILSFSRLGIKNTDNTAPNSQLTIKLQNYFQKIQISGEKLLGFIDDLLDSAKFESGKMELLFEHNELNALVESFLNEQEARLHELDITLTISDSSNGQHQAQFDKQYIGMAVNNLISNAIKYSPVGGLIAISITPCSLKNEPAICFAIQDQGIGIPETQLDSIFEKFVQSSNTMSGGTGLGLSLCKNIILAHGGQIWAENCIENGTITGARFSFMIPEKHQT